jgi:hypothetical protein
MHEGVLLGVCTIKDRMLFDIQLMMRDPYTFGLQHCGFSGFEPAN